jgi:hypothetical protein
MQLVSQLDSAFFLATLNGGQLPDDLSAQKEFLAGLPAGMEGMHNWAKQAPDFLKADDSDFPADRPLNDIFYRHGTQFMIDHLLRQSVVLARSATWPAVGAILRENIDGWIESGYDDANIETPLRRYLPHNLRKKLESFVQQNPLQVRVQDWGEVVGFWPQTRTASANFAAYEALRLTVTLLGSDLKYAIAKCLKCETYFERAKLQEVFKRGAYCPRHSKGAGTDKERKDEREQLLRCAMRFWSQWTPAKHPNQALWIAGKVNGTRRGAERHISQKWVSRNRIAIQERMRKEGLNAKG